MKLELLPKIKSPNGIKRLSIKQLSSLASEIRQVIIETVSQNGGHLAPNLGTIELTVALHYFFASPKDKIIWDVGHQAYAHKLLTGRFDNFHTLRQFKGLSGYLKPTESEHDIFGAGHVGTAVSAALGLAQARDMLKEQHEVVAIIGDGSLTNGVTYEGINNIGNLDTNITVVLNDNKWSISKNIGGIAKYLEKLSTAKFEGEGGADLGSIFHGLGFSYFGPIDGHNIEALIHAFALSKTTLGPKLIHVVTQKGKGHTPSEAQPDIFHSTNPFTLESGKISKDTINLTYTKAFGQALIKLATKDKRIVAITAAMPAGTGLDKFGELFPSRFFDAGIAEEHAIIFAAGLALRGFKPVVAIYSTFLQRSYDQLIHDLALQKIPVILAVDRAGLVGSDGPTHHGAFDLSYLRHIPNLTLMAPKDENELQNMLCTAMEQEGGPVAIRYPRGFGTGTKLNDEPIILPVGKAEKIRIGQDVAILAIGSMVRIAEEAAKTLEVDGINATVYNARWAKPIDQSMIQTAAKIGRVITIEENILEGGFGSAVLEEFEKHNINHVQVKRIGIEGFVEHGEVSELRKLCGLTSENITKNVRSLFKITNPISFPK